MELWSFDEALDHLNSTREGRVKIYDEIVDKFGDLALERGKTAMIAEFAGLFIERIDAFIFNFE